MQIDTTSNLYELIIADPCYERIVQGIVHHSISINFLLHEEM